MASLSRLSQEWMNRLQPDYLDENGRLISMRALETELLGLKDRISYKQNWKQLATKSLSRHAHDPQYIAALLYLIDERRLPISDLQPIIGLQLGHLYRQLRRAGIVFRAHSKGLGARLRDDYHPYAGVVFLDPGSGTLLQAGVRVSIPEGTEIFKDLDGDAENEGERSEVMGLLGTLPGTRVPVPLFRPESRPTRRPPTFTHRRTDED